MTLSLQTGHKGSITLKIAEITPAFYGYVPVNGIHPQLLPVNPSRFPLSNVCPVLRGYQFFRCPGTKFSAFGFADLAGFIVTVQS